MKKIFTTLCVFAGLMLTACGGANNESKPAESSKGSDSQQPANPDSYQFWGKLEEGGSFASFTDAAFLLNLNVDGKTTLDRYNFASYDASAAATNKSYVASYMSGSWKAVQKEGVDALQIKLAFVEEDGSESGASTYYAYESDGVYSVDLTVALVKGQSFTRTVEMTGQKGQKYADADAFIQAYKKEFVEPTNILKVNSKESGGVAYVQEDGKVLIYVGTNNVANGTYVKTATSLTIKLGETEIPVTLTAEKGSFSYTYDLAGYQQIELAFEFPIADFATLPVTEQGGEPGGETPVDENVVLTIKDETHNATLPFTIADFAKLPVTEQGGGTPVDENVVLALKDATNNATLTFNKDKTYKINMDFGANGAFDVQQGAWSFANYKVTLTPESGDAYESKVEDAKFIIETHISWGGGAVNRDLHFEDSQNVIGNFIAA